MRLPDFVGNSLVVAFDRRFSCLTSLIAQACPAAGEIPDAPERGSGPRLSRMYGITALERANSYFRHERVARKPPCFWPLTVLTYTIATKARALWQLEKKHHCSAKLRVVERGERSASRRLSVQGDYCYSAIEDVCATGARRLAATDLAALDRRGIPPNNLSSSENLSSSGKYAHSQMETNERALVQLPHHALIQRRHAAGRDVGRRSQASIPLHLRIRLCPKTQKGVAGATPQVLRFWGGASLCPSHPVTQRGFETEPSLTMPKAD
jgi:hypothetical protein